LWKQLAKMATRPADDEPQPPRQKEKEKTDSGLFRRTATALIRRIAPHVTALPWLADTLDWLNLWQPGVIDGCADDLSRNPASNDLSLRL
jgi:hypothetical protein